MIRQERVNNALYAIHQVLIRARWLAYQDMAGGKNTALADLLDSAELLPALIAGQEDNTEVFRRQLEGIAAKSGYVAPLEAFDFNIPFNWGRVVPGP